MYKMRGKRWEEHLFDFFVQASPLEQEKTSSRVEE